MGSEVSRRTLLKGGAALGLGAAAVPFMEWNQGWARVHKKPLRKPGSRPFPKVAEGTEMLPEIDHIIVVMMENHSFDNYLGMLGRGDGFTLKRGQPTNSNPYETGKRLRAYRMPNTCQLDTQPSQAWNASHISLKDKNQGFVDACGPVAMGYWTADDIPFYYGLAKTFPLCDRWFGSTLAQTYPNRRFLMAGTAYGTITTDVQAVLTLAPPQNGTIFERLDAHGVSWMDYASDVPQTFLFPQYAQAHPEKTGTIDGFVADAAAGKLPAFSLVDPPFVGPGSEENDQNIQIGEAFMAKITKAVLEGAAWDKSLLIWCYDEHGGYYDHVVPPKAVKPDDIPPMITVPPDEPGGYNQYGFRIPAVIVSPYARKRYVSHVVHDHTSVLKLLETKWNLGALTYRDANADNLLDSLDLKAKPAFMHPPTLPEPGQVSNPNRCTPGDPGVIPPPDAVISA